MKYTRGPWNIDSSHVRTAINSGSKHIAMVNLSKDISEEEHSANAKLISIAPVLIESLENIIWKLNRKEEKNGTIAWAKIDRNDAVIRTAVKLINDHFVDTNK